MRVLVTGGVGFIGRATVEAMVSEGFEVTVVDRDESPGRSRPGVDFIAGDLRDPSVVKDALSAAHDGVVHLAAMTSVLRSVERPGEVFESNVGVTAALLEGCRAYGIANFVMGSTNAVVGNGATGLLTEKSPLAPLTPYGATKAAAEMLLSSYVASYGMAACSLRFTNVYGPGMANKDSVVARLMRAALYRRGIQIYGDGEQVRDYLFVGDAARAVLVALRGEVGGPLIVGSGTSTSMNELHRMACRATGVEIAAQHVARRQGEMAAVRVDTSRAASLGLTPSRTLEEGLVETWRYFESLAEPG